MYRYAQVIYPMLRVVAYSMIIYLHSFDNKGGRVCIDTTLVNGFTCGGNTGQQHLQSGPTGTNEDQQPSNPSK